MGAVHERGREQRAPGAAALAASPVHLHACTHAATLSLTPASPSTGYRNFAQLRADPDLAPLRADPRFEGLLSRFERSEAPKGFLGLF